MKKKIAKHEQLKMSELTSANRLTKVYTEGQNVMDSRWLDSWASKFHPYRPTFMHQVIDVDCRHKRCFLLLGRPSTAIGRK